MQDKRVTAQPQPVEAADTRSVLSYGLVFGILVFGFSVELLGHAARNWWPNHRVISDAMTVIALATVLSPALVLTRRLLRARMLKLTMWMAVLFVIASQAIDITGRLMVTVPVLGGEGVGHDTARWILLVLGMVMLLASFYFALLEALTAERELLREQRELLAESEKRRLLAEALVEQDNIYRAAISQAGAIPYRINWQTKTYTFYDDQIYKLTGHSPEELTFERMQSLPQETRYLGPLAGLPVEEIKRSSSEGAVRNWQREYRIVSKFGEEKWISDSSVELIDADGFIVETVGLMHDITARKREDEAILRNERYFRALIENAQDLITVINFDGTIRYDSPSVKRLLGYDPDERVGQNVLELIHPEDRPRVLKSLVNGLKRPGTSKAIKLRCRHKDGTWRKLESIGHALLDDPDVEGAVINSRDITEREQLEEQLLHSQKMQGIGRLAGGVAHDFNNLLTGIMGYCEFALGNTEGDERLQGQLEQILQAAQRAADLTRQLLAFARKQIVEPRNTDLNTLTMNLDKMLRRLIGEDVELTTIPSEEPAVVCIDPGQFEQVVINLAVNARDAMPHGGNLTIEIAPVILDEEYAKYHSEVSPGEYIMLAVSDTGIGMSEDVRAHIFEPFFTTKEDGKGTGLGLATCYGIVKQVGGHIWVYSEPGNGTTFKIYLPRVKGEAIMRGRRAAAAPAAGGCEVILLVEDEPIVRAITHQTLIEKGYRVLEATDPTSALQIAAKNEGRIDLLLTDVVLPRMSGRELAEQLRAEHPGLTVLYMSGYTEDAIVKHGVLERGIEFLPKPFAPETLARKVRSVLDHAKRANLVLS